MYEIFICFLKIWATLTVVTEQQKDNKLVLFAHFLKCANSTFTARLWPQLCYTHSNDNYFREWIGEAKKDEPWVHVLDFERLKY